MKRRKPETHYVKIPKGISHRMQRTAGTYITPAGGGNGSSYNLLRRFRPSMYFDLMAKLSGK